MGNRRIQTEAAKEEIEHAEHQSRFHARVLDSGRRRRVAVPRRTRNGRAQASRVVEPVITDRQGAPRAFTGAWRSQRRYLDRALAPAPGVDPAHRFPDRPDEGARPPSGAPKIDVAPMYATESEDAAYAHELSTPGLVLDFESALGHSPDDLSVPIPSPAHSEDRGGAKRQTHEEPFMRFHDERHFTTRTETTPDRMGDPTVASLRGDNSLPQNNPEGYRFGWYVWRRMQRRMFQNGPEVRHLERMLRPGGAATATVSVQPQNPGRYTSPFSWNRKFIESRLQSGILRRDPPEPQTLVTNDGTEQSDTDTFVDFVIG
jgi:hypothetical protein